MKEEHGKIEGNLSVSEEYSLHGMVIGNIIVKPGGILQLHGMCCGNLTVEAGGYVYLHGKVNGDATNQGGQLEVYGMINGRLFRSAGITKVDKNAVVTGGLL